jgi:hypothetical protein
MSSANILQQAGVSVLAQANASTQSVLKLVQYLLDPRRLRIVRSRLPHYRNRRPWLSR